MRSSESPRTLALGPMRAVRTIVYHKGVNCPHGGKRARLLLECGHEKTVKASKAPVRSMRARCYACRPR